MKNLPILLKREAWEHNSFWIVPAVVVAIVILGSLGGIVHGVGGSLGFSNFVEALEIAPDNMRRGTIFGMFLTVGVLFFLTVMPFVTFFYLLDSLYSERKERHILFWKSMPVSDMETVMSKVITATFVIPIFFLAGVLITKILFLMISTVFVWIGGGSASELLWEPAPLFADFGLTIYYILSSGLWMLPFTGWLLLASSLAKKARPFMWAVLVPIFIIILENMVIGHSNFFEMVVSYLNAYSDDAFSSQAVSDFASGFKDGMEGNESRGLPMDKGVSLNGAIDPVGMLTSLKFWIGQVIGVSFIAAAIYIRRFRDDS